MRCANHDILFTNFYPKLDYICCGLGEDWPLGHQQSYFHKLLQH